MSQQPSFKILALIFPNFNILDLTGPAEVFGNSRIPPSSRWLQIASSTEITKAYEGLSIKRDISLSELQDDDLEGYDLLLLPGASPQFVVDAIEKDETLMDVVRRFGDLEKGGGKWMFSVCTGALFLGAAGVLGGRTATTHWGGLDQLRDISMKAGKEANVVRKRFVDGGRTEGGVRIVNAGGVSCGIDAALWILGEMRGMGVAREVAGVMDYEWKYEKVEVTEGWIVGE